MAVPKMNDAKIHYFHFIYKGLFLACLVIFVLLLLQKSLISGTFSDPYFNPGVSFLAEDSVLAQFFYINSILWIVRYCLQRRYIR